MLGSKAKAAQFIMPDQLALLFSFQHQSFCCLGIIVHTLIGGE